MCWLSTRLEKMQEEARARQKEDYKRVESLERQLEHMNSVEKQLRQDQRSLEQQKDKLERSQRILQVSEENAWCIRRRSCVCVCTLVMMMIWLFQAENEDQAERLETFVEDQELLQTQLEDLESELEAAQQHRPAESGHTTCTPERARRSL